MTDPILVRYVPETSGVMLYITPLSPFLYPAISRKAEALYPDPDPTPYRFPVADAAIPGMLTEARDHPEYQRLIGEAIRKRKGYITQALIVAACEPADGRAVLIARYAAELEKWRKVADLPADEWEAVLLTCVIRTDDEMQHIIDIAGSIAPLTQEEVVEGTARFFRYDVSRKTTAVLAGQTPIAAKRARGA